MGLDRKPTIRETVGVAISIRIQRGGGVEDLDQTVAQSQRTERGRSRRDNAAERTMVGEATDRRLAATRNHLGGGEPVQDGQDAGERTKRRAHGRGAEDVVGW